MTSSPVVLAVTAGDPCGIGPEVILKVCAQGLPARARFVFLGDHTVFERLAGRLRLPLPRWHRVSPDALQALPDQRVVFVEAGRLARWVPGRPSAQAGQAAVASLDAALALWRSGQIHGIVTGPVTKWAIRQLRPSFVGQTEYLARAAGSRDVAMAFVSDTLRVVLLTRHVPLGRVPRAIDATLVRTTVRLTAAALRRWFHVPHPRMAILGINPHAGEGVPRSEEARVIRPALAALRRQGLACDGPFAADGFFARASAYDAILCAYHDQGLIPFKLVACDRGCQLSLGLPFVRTSPDHGSALDIAGRGVAHPGSMRYALALAATLASQKVSDTFFMRC